MKKEQERGKLGIFLIVVILLSLVLVAITSATLYEQKGTIVWDKDKSSENLNMSYLNLAAPEAIDYTEGPMISIPVITVPGRMSLPLSLDYRTGIKVKEEASWVGLGWDLGVGAIKLSLCMPGLGQGIT